MMFELKQCDYFLWARIAKKFKSVHIGVKFYRSCKTAKDVVERAELSWPLPDTTLGYLNDRRYASSTGPLGINSWPNISLELCKIECVDVSHCSADYFKRVVLPDLEAMASVALMFLCRHLRVPVTEEEVQPLLAAGKPQAVAIWGGDYDINSDVIRNVTDLHVHDGVGRDVRYVLQKPNIFEIMSGKKNISFYNDSFEEKSVRLFLKRWLTGATTGSLEKLTYNIRQGYFDVERLDKIVKNVNMQKLMKSFVEELGGEFDEFVLERKGSGRLCIRIDYSARNIEFYFS